MFELCRGAVYFRGSRRDIEAFRNGTHSLVAPLEINANDLQNKLLAFILLPKKPKKRKKSEKGIKERLSQKILLTQPHAIYGLMPISSNIVY